MALLTCWALTLPIPLRIVLYFSVFPKPLATCSVYRVGLDLPFLRPLSRFVFSVRFATFPLESIHLPALKTLQMIRGFESPSRRSVYFGSIGFYPSMRFARILDLECSKYHPSLTFHLISADRIFLRFVGFVPASPIR